jgi:hypothetical protein
LLVGVYAVWGFGRQIKKIIAPFVLYAVIAILIMFATWPYLWSSPLSNFVEVLRFMSDNPTELPVLFRGEIYPAGSVPRSYLPFLLLTTLTEPVWILFIAGLVIGSVKLFRQKNTTGLVSLSLTVSWTVLLITYAILRRPAMYDGFRHFMFIIPPIFIVTGFAFEWLLGKIATYWLRATLLLLILLPGMIGIATLHPYEYAYYNSFVGGTNTVFREYETEYWLTCYKEAIAKLDQQESNPANLYVHREAYIADYYAGRNFDVLELRGAMNEVQSGDYVLVSSRSNEDQKIFKDAPTIIQVTRGEATFCVIKRIP